ncbi:MAG: ATP phosphoribosyltransferase [Microbacteriaceae bacterium]
MLRIALPNKGVLAEPATLILSEAGYHLRKDPKDLYIPDTKNGVEFFFLRPRDIATYVGSGALDVGITGRDLLLDSPSAAQEILDLRFGKSTFHFAAPAGKYSQLSELNGLRIGTSYEHLVGEYLAKQGISAKVVKLDGAVENSVRLGVADAIADVVETGATIKAAGLELLGESLLSSTASLILSPTISDDARGALSILQRRLEGILVARQYALVDYVVPVDLLDAATALTPGLESPTVSPLKDEHWVAVRAMVPHNDINHILDALHDLGARAILVSSIKSARL